VGVVPTHSTPTSLPVHVREARADRFIEVGGRRMAMLGRESGELELWMWPLKVAHGITVRPRPIVDGTPGEARVTRVAVRPDSAELTWVHPEFTLRQRIFAALERRAMFWTFLLEGATPIRVDVRLVADLRPMWPAGMGGQIATRDQATGALLLTEELGRYAVLIGSPEAEPVAAGGDHALGGEAFEIELALTPARGGRGPLSLYFVGAELEPPLLSEAARRGDEGAALGLARCAAVIAAARGEWRHTEREARGLEREHVEHWMRFRESCSAFDCSDQALTDAVRDAQIAIERAWVEVDGLGRGLVAGLAPSAAGERPGFGWFFDGDAMIAARAMSAYGDFRGARDVLRFAASHQRADGKLMHELVLSANSCDWLEDYPYAYYKADNSPRFASCLAQVVSASGDRELTLELLPAAERALQWCEGCLDDDGRLANSKAGLAAVEAGPLCGRIQSEVFLQGLWLDSLRALERLALSCQRDALGARARELGRRAAAGFEAFWSAEHGRYGFALLTDGGRNDDLTAYVAHPIARGFGHPARALATARALNHPSLVADWGARMFATEAEVYDPGHYNSGSVFPYLTQFVALALYRHGISDAGLQVLRSLAALSNFSGLGFLPEHLRGDRAVAPARGVPHQVFSSAGLVQVVYAGLMGIVPDALEGAFTLAPALPAEWDSARVRGLRVGRTRLDLAVHRTRLAGRSTLRFELRRTEGPPLRVRLAPLVPPGSIVRAARRGGDSLRTVVADLGGGARRVEVEQLELERELEVDLDLCEGPSLLLPAPVLEQGARSEAPRLVVIDVAGARVRFELWGPAGRELVFPVRSDRAWSAAGPARRDGDEVCVCFPADKREDFTRCELELYLEEPPA